MGKTKAKNRANFCLHFSHGCCFKGEKCPFYHRIPTKEDDFPVTLDCFGREKHRTERDDMMGGILYFSNSLQSDPLNEKERIYT
jgi:hypothetical protein